jgi:hypothetical protein
LNLSNDWRVPPGLQSCHAVGQAGYGALRPFQFYGDILGNDREDFMVVSNSQ